MNRKTAPRRGGSRTARTTPRRRNTLRLSTWDYADDGYYFVTLVTNGRELLFEEQRLRSIVESSWQWLSENFEHVELDEYVVMPNHLHGIIVLCRDVVPGRSRTAPTLKPLGRLVGAFKTVSTKAVNELCGTPGAIVWQRNFYDRIIRNDQELDAARRYVRENPAKWDLDPNRLYHACAMTTFTIRLPRHQARLVALAVGYHLSRPGAEIDSDSMREYTHGLAELLPLIDAQIEADAAALDLNPTQAVLLSTAFSAVLSELKMYSLSDSMAAVDDRLRWLFPEIAGDPAYAMVLAEDLTMLRREVPSQRAREVLAEQRSAAAEAKKRRGKWWQVWRR